MLLVHCALRGSVPSEKVLLFYACAYIEWEEEGIGLVKEMEVRTPSVEYGICLCHGIGNK